jgi:hypothetical protein
MDLTNNMCTMDQHSVADLATDLKEIIGMIKPEKKNEMKCDLWMGSGIRNRHRRDITCGWETSV